MTTPIPAPPTGAHPNHDRLLISAHAAGDLAGRDLATADALLAACEDCRTLHADLRAIASATRDLPAPASASARDFRIPPERAAVLVRGGFWRRLLRPFGRPGGASRPLAMAFTTLGVAGLLLASLPTLQLAPGDASRATAPEVTNERDAAQATAAVDTAPPFDTSGGAEYQPSGQGTGVGARPTALPVVASDGAGAGGPKVQPTGESAGSGTGAGATAEPTAESGGVPELAMATDGSSGPSPLVLLSVAFLAAGLGLMILRVAALRLR